MSSLGLNAPDGVAAPRATCELRFLRRAVHPRLSRTHVRYSAHLAATGPQHLSHYSEITHVGAGMRCGGDSSGYYAVARGRGTGVYGSVRDMGGLSTRGPRFFERAIQDIRDV